MARSSEGKRHEDQSPPRVVILGGGYGGVYTALSLQRAARRRQIELSLVSRENFFLYQPMLAEIGVGQHRTSPHREPDPAIVARHQLSSG